MHNARKKLGNLAYENDYPAIERSFTYPGVTRELLWGRSGLLIYRVFLI
ncbi:hypothetical protein ACFLW0_05345 [Chloroflexota bacterium]